ncbi:ABC transporter, ATP-binding protein [Alteracholeplasma palmae J233]|uniref:ABC transporter, ATP-binding protein n=1 Tax=Alteracholeplasma palmae (strain ATCC 49389 / J233) TaxID=1318466 RepID=U4KR86_ALTPJ|nr:ABC transporter ATP-binding protein [Alteracholeplasma palmae]CCV63941.1 ABC transporter, ATP-binding protein [Alteracholeplasma palmae J233]
MIKKLIKFVNITFRINPIYYFIMLLVSGVTIIGLIFNMYQITYMIDMLLNQTKEEALKAGLYLVVINVLIYTVKTILEYFQENESLKTKQKINHYLAKKLMNMPYHYLENTYYLDLKERARFANDNQDAIGQLLAQLSSAFSSVVTIVSLGALLVAYDYIIIAILGVTTLMSILVILKGLKTQLGFYKDIIPVNRKYNYYLSELGKVKYAKEYRFSDMGKLMQRELKDFTEKTVKNFDKLNKKSSLYESLLASLQYIQMGGIYLYLGFKTLYQTKLISSFTYYTQIIFNFYQTLVSFVRQLITLKGLSQYVAPFIELAELKSTEEKGSKILEEIKTVEFKNVSFTYPNTKNQILNNISFKINANEKISIVGLNGSGKTTIIKLLTRLYDVTEGEILINDINIKEYDIKNYRKILSTVFQDFKMFSYDIASNIDPTYKKELLYKVLDKVDLKDKIEGLKFKEKTSYTKDYDPEGVMFSGGEEQKMAIARALYKQSDLIILDEPTSALDPMTEAAIYENFNEIVLNKTTIYISHRMSSSTFCDKILVINDGKVESFLPHKELMKNKESLYYQLFMSQAKNYKITKENIAHV